MNKSGKNNLKWIKTFAMFYLERFYFRLPRYLKKKYHFLDPQNINTTKAPIIFPTAKSL